MCGSGMRAMMFAHDMLAAGSASVLVALVYWAVYLRPGALPPEPSP